MALVAVLLSFLWKSGNVAWNLAPHWGKRRKKRGEIGKILILVTEPNRAVLWGGGEGTWRPRSVCQVLRPVAAFQ